MSGNAMREADDFADSILRGSKTFLKPLARVLLLSTFMEDGTRMLYQWNDQVRFFSTTWGVYIFIAQLFVFLNFVGQIGGVALVLSRKFVRVGLYMLMGIVLFQSLAYPSLWTFAFFLKNLAILGSLMLLLAETTESARNLFAGLPIIEVNRTGNYLQLAGRVLIVVMFIALLKFNSTFRAIIDLVGLVLVALIAVGFKTKVAALVLVVMLFVENVTLNAWWNYSFTQRDFIKYDFFQTMSVIGGLMMVVALGPGGVSLDQHKKDY